MATRIIPGVKPPLPIRFNVRPPVRLMATTQGITRGEAGLSAYELALATGFTGTLEDWMRHLYRQTATFEALDFNGAVGAGPKQVARGDHDHEIGNMVLHFENQLI